MGPIGCSETSVRNYHSALRKILKHRSFHLHRDESLKITHAHKLFSFIVGSNFGVLTEVVVTFWSEWKNAFVFHFHSFSSYKYGAITRLQGWNFSTSSPVAPPRIHYYWSDTKLFLPFVWMCVKFDVSLLGKNAYSSMRKQWGKKYFNEREEVAERWWKLTTDELHFTS
jgi:hypothetical protein